MQVVKRDGQREPVNFQKIVTRIEHLCTGLDIHGNRYGEALKTLDPIKLSMKVIEYIKDGITTRELDEHTAESATLMAFENPEYGVLAGRILISNHHKNTLDSFSITMKRLYEYKDEQGRASPLISRDLYKFVERFGKRIDAEIDYLRDFLFDYTGFKTLERSYLLKYQTGTYMVQERPQHMHMRVALGILGPCTTASIISGSGGKLDPEEILTKVFETYFLLSLGFYTHATPTIYNAGTPRPQLSSCFLFGVPDSLKGIYKALSDCAEISKWAGGIGLHLSDIRPAGSYIHGTNGRSNGILPMLKVFSDTAKYVDQCFTPDTLLYTPSGPVPIGKLSVGDYVISHQGIKQKVERVLRHQVKSEVLRIKIKYSIDPVVVTSEHQVLVLRKDPNIQDLETILKRLDHGYARLEFCDANTLRVGDYIVFPKSCILKDTRPIDFTWGGNCMSRITDISYEEYEGHLYDLEVENDHTYVTVNLGIVHNGGGKRMGSFACYLEPWHPEILEFLQAKLPNGHEELRARHLYYALWIPDLFMRRLSLAVEEETKALAENRPKKVILWSTFCPHECPGLSDVWGTEFDTLYHKYESEGKARAQLDIMKIWIQILDTQKETGIPYLCYKDAANAKSNQQNIGTIKSSNLCTEIIEYSDSKEYATCNLASISLPKHLKSVPIPGTEETKYEVDHDTLMKTAYIITCNLNRVIDINYYPVPETKLSNERHRPIGIGVQGLADLFHMMKLPFDSAEALVINRDIFETIYYGALKASHDLAVKDGPYSTFKGSPASKGVLQFDMWNHKPSSGRYDWLSLKQLIIKDGIRNSLLVAPMPTASTAQILGNTECFEPVSYNIYVKRVLAGEFTIVNKHLQRDLSTLGLWTESLRQRLLKSRGSLQDEKIFSDIPLSIRNQYKTASELKQKALIDMAVARGYFIDQSQSLNLFVKAPNDSVLTSMHLYAWKQGLKTGIYYLRRETVSKAQQFTVAPRNFSERRDLTNPELTVTAVAEATATSTTGTIVTKVPTVYIPDPSVSVKRSVNAGKEEDDVPMCRRDNPDCEACGS